MRERLSQALTSLAQVQLALDRERLLRVEREGLFDLVLDSMSDALLLVDRRGQVWRANDAAVRVYGRTADDLVGRGVREILGEGIPASPWDIAQRAEQGEDPDMELSLEVAGGEHRYLSVSFALVQDEHGKIEGAVYSARDLSETQQLARALAEAEARWRLLAEVGTELGSEIDPHTVLPALSQRLQEAVGFDAVFLLAEDGVVRTVVGADEGPLADQLALLVDRAPDRRSALWKAISTGQIVRAPAVARDFPLITPARHDGVRSGALVPLEARGAVLGAMLLYSDTERAIGEREIQLVQEISSRVALALANARLRESLSRTEATREAARMREEMIASVSHDMQTPLAALLALSRTLRERPDLDPDRRDQLHEAMWRQSLSLRRLVQQFLDYARLEVGRPLTISSREVDVRGILDELVRDFSSQAPIQLDAPEELPALADPDRLRQVVANLLSNAIKFSPPDSPVTIVARPVREGAEIVVRDRGSGIGPADLANLFEKFYRGANASGVQGTGIGLYISRALVEAQGGRLTVSSRVGKGSSFSVTLPVPVAPPAEASV